MGKGWSTIAVIAGVLSISVALSAEVRREHQVTLTAGPAAMKIAPHGGGSTDMWYSDHHLTFEYPPFLSLSTTTSVRQISILLTLSREFRISVQEYSGAVVSLDQWLATPNEDDPPFYQTNYALLDNLVQGNPGMYIASTTIAGFQAIEVGFDCSNIALSPSISHAAAITTVVKNRLYEFTAADICYSTQGADVFRSIIATVSFLLTE